MTRSTARASKHTIDSRTAFLRCGIDYGSDARVLLVQGYVRLVWTKASSTLIGIRGCGHVSHPCQLELREFKLENGQLRPYRSTTLLSGGRLSRARLESIAAQLDSVFGAGTAAKLNYRETTVLGGDLVHAWLDHCYQQEVKDQQNRSRELSRTMDALSKDNFSGIQV